MQKITENQKERILAIRKEVIGLQDKCNSLYEDLVKELALEKFNEAEGHFTENPLTYLFDLVYNAELYSDVDVYMRALERSINTLNNKND
jgi:hypothetical protein